MTANDQKRPNECEVISDEIPQEVGLITCEWKGPYGVIPREGRNWVVSQPEALAAGIYLWTVKCGEAYRINYVGISRTNIAARILEHLGSYIKGHYDFYDSKEYSTEVRPKPIYYAKRHFRAWYQDRAVLLPKLLRQFEIMDVFFAPLDNVDKITLERIESGLIDVIRECDSTGRAFLDNYRRSRVVQLEEKNIEIRFVNHELLDCLESRPSIMV